MENDWIAIYGPKFHDYREWKVFQYVAFANDIQQNGNSHVLSIEINDEGTIILTFIRFRLFGLECRSLICHI